MMDKLKIARELDYWVKENLGDKFYVNAEDGDLNLGIYVRGFVQEEFAWFTDFDTKRFNFDSIDIDDDDMNGVIASKGMISIFYHKAIEVIQSGVSKEELGMKYVKKPIAVEAYQTKSKARKFVRDFANKTELIELKKMIEDKLKNN